jgi:hypothetical protein
VRGGGGDDEARDEEREQAALQRYFSGVLGAEDEITFANDMEYYMERWAWDGSGEIEIPFGGEGSDGDDEDPTLYITVKRVPVRSSY